MLNDVNRVVPERLILAPDCMHLTGIPYSVTLPCYPCRFHYSVTLPYSPHGFHFEGGQSRMCPCRVTGMNDY